MSAFRDALTALPAAEPFERSRMITVCEFSRSSARAEWLERLELWQVRPSTVLLSAVRVYPWDRDVEECWLSQEACTISQLVAAFRAWALDRGADRRLQRDAARRIVEVVARWRPEFPDLPSVDGEPPKLRELASAG